MLFLECRKRISGPGNEELRPFVFFIPLLHEFAYVRIRHRIVTVARPPNIRDLIGETDLIQSCLILVDPLGIELHDVRHRVASPRNPEEHSFVARWRYPPEWLILPLNHKGPTAAEEIGSRRQAADACVGP